MDDKDMKNVDAQTTVSTDEIVWGETNQERIVDSSSRHKSLRHHCKGPQCGSAFEKL